MRQPSLDASVVVDVENNAILAEFHMGIGMEPSNGNKKEDFDVIIDLIKPKLHSCQNILLLRTKIF